MYSSTQAQGQTFLGAINKEALQESKLVSLDISKRNVQE